MTINLICLDADDTLWHNMRHFNATEEALVAMLQPFADAHIARDTLNACEGRNLKLYGYGAKGFTLSMIETAAELAGDQISKTMIEEILAAGRALLAHPVDLFDDVAETLDALAHRGRLVLVTKGDLLHQESKLAASGLGDLFSGIEIVSERPKTPSAACSANMASPRTRQSWQAIRCDPTSAPRWKRVPGPPISRRKAPGSMKSRTPRRTTSASARSIVSRNCRTLSTRSVRHPRRPANAPSAAADIVPCGPAICPGHRRSAASPGGAAGGSPPPPPNR